MATAAPPSRSTPPALPVALLDQPQRPSVVLAARAHQRAGRPGMARAAFEAGWAAEPLPEIALLVGVLHQAGGAHDRALRWFERADVPALADFVAFRVVRSAAALGDAATALHAAERVAPDSRFAPHAARQAARALLAAGDADAAQAWLTHWLAHRAPDEDVTTLQTLQAEALSEAGRFEEAARRWRRLSVQLADSDAGERATKAYRRLRWRMPAERWRALSRPDPDEHLLLGRADRDAHRYAELEARMVEALRADIADPAITCETWWLLARARTRLRTHPAAAAAYRRFAEACARDSRAPSARFAEARAWFTADDTVAALDAARALWRGWPTHRLADDARLLAARIERAAGRPALAKDHLRALLWYTPEGDVAADAAWLLRTMDADPPPVTASDRAHVGRLRYFQGRDAARQGDMEAARAALTEVRRVSPSGYYGTLAALWLARLDPGAFARAEGPARPLPAPLLSWPGHAEGRLLVDLGLTQDAWWAFDAAGPGPMERGRFQATVAQLFAARGHDDAALRMFAKDVPHLDGLRWQDVPTAWLDAVYPMPWLEHFTAAAETHDLPLSLLLALAHTESRFNPRARSWAGACGPMQLVPRTAQAVARRAGVRGRMTCRRLRNPAVSIPIAAQYLSELRARFGAHPVALAIAYNAGPGNARRWLDGDRPAPDALVEGLDFRQPRRYVKRVVAAMTIYEGRLTGALPPVPLDW